MLAIEQVAYIFGVIYFDSYCLSVNTTWSVCVVKGGSPLVQEDEAVAVDIVPMDVVMGGDVKCGARHVRQLEVKYRIRLIRIAITDRVVPVIEIDV